MAKPKRRHVLLAIKQDTTIIMPKKHRSRRQLSRNAMTDRQERVDGYATPKRRLAVSAIKLEGEANCGEKSVLPHQQLSWNAMIIMPERHRTVLTIKPEHR